MKNRVLSLIGLAYRASKIIIGVDETIVKLKERKVNLVFLDKDLTTNTLKELSYECEISNARLVREFTKEELSHAIGKKNVSVIGIIDEGFKKLIEESL